MLFGDRKVAHFGNHTPTQVSYVKALAKLANIACPTLLFVSVSLVLDDNGQRAYIWHFIRKESLVLLYRTLIFPSFAKPKGTFPQRDAHVF